MERHIIAHEDFVFISYFYIKEYLHLKPFCPTNLNSKEQQFKTEAQFGLLLGFVLRNPLNKQYLLMSKNIYC